MLTKTKITVFAPPSNYRRSRVPLARPAEKRAKLTAGCCSNLVLYVYTRRNLPVPKDLRHAVAFMTSRIVMGLCFVKVRLGRGEPLRMHLLFLSPNFRRHALRQFVDVVS